MFARYGVGPNQAFDGKYRIILMHDPYRFKDMDFDFPCAVFSGHLHGGMHSSLKHLQNCIGGELIISGGFRNGRRFLYAHVGQGSRSLGTNILSRMGVPLEHSIVTLGFSDFSRDSANSRGNLKGVGQEPFC